MYVFPEYFVDFEYNWYNNTENIFLLCILFASIFGISQFFRKYFKMNTVSLLDIGKAEMAVGYSTWASDMTAMKRHAWNGLREALETGYWGLIGS